jgi:HTH-type transcriptional regulator / antitoxin HigA
MDNIKPIKTDADLAWAIGEIEPYFDAPPTPGTPEADRFDVLADLIEAYENRYFPVDELEPVAMLRAFMQMTNRAKAILLNCSAHAPGRRKSSIASER